MPWLLLLEADGWRDCGFGPDYVVVPGRLRLALPSGDPKGTGTRLFCGWIVNYMGRQGDVGDGLVRVELDTTSDPTLAEPVEKTLDGLMELLDQTGVSSRTALATATRARVVKWCQDVLVASNVVDHNGWYCLPRRIPLPAGPGGDIGWVLGVRQDAPQVLVFRHRIYGHGIDSLGTLAGCEFFAFHDLLAWLAGVGYAYLVPHLESTVRYLQGPEAQSTMHVVPDAPLLVPPRRRDKALRYAGPLFGLRLGIVRACAGWGGKPSQESNYQ
jgi:hypothetical protein